MEMGVRRCGLMPSIAVVEETRSVEVFSLDVVHIISKSKHFGMKSDHYLPGTVRVVFVPAS